MKSKRIIAILAGIIVILHAFNKHVLAAPINDNFSSATIISGSSGQVSGDNIDATIETDEPDHAGVEGGVSVWWSWTAPLNGTVAFDTVGSDFDTLLAVYTGSEVSDLTSIASNDQFDGNLSRITFNVTAGTTYRIAVDGTDGVTGNIILNWEYGTPPTNDNFSSATIINSSSGQGTGNNTFATFETGEPNHDGIEGGASAWWSWTAPLNGTVAFDTIGSDFDTVLAAYTGSEVSDLTPIASNDQFNDNDNNNQSRITFNATAGTTYRIAVDGYHSERGNIFLNWQYGTPPTNDNFSSATTINGSRGQTTANNMFATVETGEPSHAGIDGSGSAWWSWTARSNGTVAFDTFGSDFDTILAAYTGSEVIALTSIASNDDSGSQQSKITFTATTGTTYRIAVDGYYGERGEIILNWNMTSKMPLSILMLLLD